MSHAVDVHVGQRLRLIRKASGLSQTTVADRLGLTFQQIQKYEKGSNRVSASKLYEIATLFGVKIEAFFEGLAAPEDTRPDAAIVPGSANDTDFAKLTRVFAMAPPATRRKIIDVIDLIAG